MGEKHGRHAIFPVVFSLVVVANEITEARNLKSGTGTYTIVLNAYTFIMWHVSATLAIIKPLT
jgi:hypothetical protein